MNECEVAQPVVIPWQVTGKHFDLKSVESVSFLKSWTFQSAASSTFPVGSTFPWCSSFRRGFARVMVRLVWWFEPRTLGISGTTNLVAGRLPDPIQAPQLNSRLTQLKERLPSNSRAS